MPLRYTARILKVLKQYEDAEADVSTLSRELGVTRDDLPVLREAIEQLIDEGHLIATDEDWVALPPIGEEIVGEFRKNPRGFGFIVPSTPIATGDIFVPPDSTSDALTGDRVRAKVITKRRKGEIDHTGVIVEILERKQSHFTGELQNQGGTWLVYPDGKSLTAPIAVEDPSIKNARAGDKVVFEILSYPEGHHLGQGVIVEVLGEAGQPDVETQAVIAAYNLPGDFPKACIDQARDAAKSFDDDVEMAEKSGSFEGREDLRGTLILTIDPPDAKDFDDALSLEKITLQNGQRGYRLGVHIADVSHFIPEDSALDEEAMLRGNSVYLPRKVIPMLPELLSNGVCSLREREPRYAKSAFIDYNERGEVQARAYASTVIHSAKRMTYLEAQAIIEGDLEEAKKHARTDTEPTPKIIKNLKDLNALAKAIHARRRKQGMIHLDLPDVELIYDDEGRVIDAEPEDDAWTHTLIEMCMVEANEAVAVLFERLGVPAMRRTHPDPEVGSYESLQKYLKAAGYSISKEPTRHELQTLLDSTRGRPEAPAVHFAVLRTLTKAAYSPAMIGHFALASEAYSHFTSPIRRYCDLTIHRQLAEFLRLTKNGSDVPKNHEALRKLGDRMNKSGAMPDEQKLSEIGARCNRTEEQASGAERELRNFLVMQLLSEKIGEVFPGVCTGVTKAGVFVRIDKYLVEGLVKAEDLPTGADQPGPGRWRLDDRTGALVEERTKRSFRLGDQVQVTVSQVNLAAKQMELLIPEGEASKRAGVGKALKLGSEGGGLGHVEGAGFSGKTGKQRRDQRSKSRDRRKKDFRQERKDGGKR